VFRNAFADVVGAFAYNLGIANSLSAELQGAMIAIEIASQKGWNHLWLETDSILVTLAFKSSKLVPWQLRNRWENYLHKISPMNFFVTHIYREGNQCADTSANIGLSHPR
jgi:ribonuclease HI